MRRRGDRLAAPPFKMAFFTTGIGVEDLRALSAVCSALETADFTSWRSAWRQVLVNFKMA